MEDVVDITGVYTKALNASTFFLAGTQGSRQFVAAHIAATFVGGAALAINAYHMLVVEDNKAGMFFELAFYVAYVVRWVTTANMDIEKDDKKEVEKRIHESEAVLGEVQILLNLFARRTTCGYD